MIDNIKAIAGLDLGGERREVTCLFVDIGALSTFPPGLRPPQIMEMLNRHLTVATNCVHNAQGVIDKYMGHEVMGLFNTQISPCDDHAARAVAAALSMREAFERLYKQLEIHPDQHNYRIGIHTGVATLGNVGSLNRRDFTAIGDSINLAKRLEENAVNGQIIISEDTLTHMRQHGDEIFLSNVLCEECDPIQVKGRQQLTRIYEVFRL
jgi:adenylate cyclase